MFPLVLPKLEVNKHIIELCELIKFIGIVLNELNSLTYKISAT